jgi:uncharacterized membrane-anchored protein YhcB (DUF1043 family)
MDHCRELQEVQDRACSLQGELAAAGAVASNAEMLREEGERNRVRAQQTGETSRLELDSASARLVEKQQELSEAHQSAQRSQRSAAEMEAELASVKSDLDAGGSCSWLCRLNGCHVHLNVVCMGTVLWWPTLNTLLVSGFWEFTEAQKQLDQCEQLNEQQRQQLIEHTASTSLLQQQLQEATASLAASEGARKEANEEAIEKSARDRASWALSHAALENKQDCQVHVASSRGCDATATLQVRGCVVNVSVI